MDSLGIACWRDDYLKNVWGMACGVKNNIYFCARVSPTRHAPSESPRA